MSYSQWESNYKVAGGGRTRMNVPDTKRKWHRRPGVGLLLVPVLLTASPAAALAASPLDAGQVAAIEPAREALIRANQARQADPDADRPFVEQTLALWQLGAAERALESVRERPELFDPDVRLQIEADAIAALSSTSRSLSQAWFDISFTALSVPTRQGVHWPQLSKW